MSLDELRTLLTRHAGPEQRTAIDGLHIARVEASGPPDMEMSGTVLAVLAQGAKRLAAGDRVHEYRPGDYLLTSIDLPVTGSFLGASAAAPALGFALVLDPSAIAELLIDAAGDLPRPQHKPAPAITVAALTDELLDAAVRLLRLLDHPRDQAILAPMIKREILWRLLTGPQGEPVRQLGLADSGLHHIARAVRWIREHYTDPFRVTDLARMSGMSPSAFYRNFQIVTGQSPIRFQKNLRLQQARLLLLSNPHDITAVAHRVGYESPSQFSREYRRMYGSAPRATAARGQHSGSSRLRSGISVYGPPPV
ncbi:AraC family transcriptional regulator [Nocardia grenadensis]|uniref:AraC family transcriptional regulator n=1 Tax=Nocardia grenadensis TaxID=931537 RepID=UPI0007A3BF32|nr:AraC family transcriptional regulator [Nocardia grenadensis]